MKSNKFWIALLGGILAISGVAALMLQKAPAGTTACIYQGGELIESIDLSAVTQPYGFIITHGVGYNEIAVEHGRIRVSHADCEDEVCVSQGWLSGGAAPIVCLPHELVIRLEGAAKSDTDYDAIAR